MGPRKPTWSNMMVDRISVVGGLKRFVIGLDGAKPLFFRLVVFWGRVPAT